MRSELASEAALRVRSSREDDQSAGIAIDAVDCTQQAPRELGRKPILERRRQITPASRPKLGRFRGMPHGRQAGGLFDDDNGIVGINDGDGFD
jgi:hypothetical protein